MKQIIAVIVLLSVYSCATPAAAETAIVVDVEPNWIEVVRTVPVESCNITQVPIYENVQGQGATGLEVLFGSVFGEFCSENAPPGPSQISVSLGKH